MKKRILSIDFDYFIDTDINTRNFKFPDGIDDKPLDELAKDWKSMYDHYPEIKDIGVTSQYQVIFNHLYYKRFDKVVVAESHKEIAQILAEIKEEDELQVVNFDFHHDNYISGGNTLDCANWVRHLKEMKPDADIVWVRRKDSEIASLTGEFPYEHTTSIAPIGHNFDYVFLCFSPEWTPPHLRYLFDDMCNATIK